MEPSDHALGDALQLAHYWRLLEACHLAANSPIGGIIGSDGGVWWFDLAEPRWRRRTISALALYDREFRLRLDVIARQIQRNDGSSLPPLVMPLRKAECQSCEWRQVCGNELVAADSVSLLPGLPWPNALRLIRDGIGRRADLARLDWSTASIMHGSHSGDAPVDVGEIIALTEGLDPSTELARALGKQKRTRLARLAELGITTVGHLDRLDERTATLSGVQVGHLPSLIDQARAAVAGHAYRARGVEHIDVPRADIEVDVDMENCEEGVYLWGTLTGAASTPAGEVYAPFVVWNALDGAQEAELFARFWTWLMQLRHSTLERAGNFLSYCYSPAENTQMRRIAAATRLAPSLDEVESFIASPHWVDLHSVVRSQLVTGTGLGLKQLAPLFGFHWRDSDPGGDASMVWYQRAVGHPDSTVREDNRTRLLRYNEDDVRATAALRSWLSIDDFQDVGSPAQ